MMRLAIAVSVALVGCAAPVREEPASVAAPAVAPAVVDAEEQAELAEAMRHYEPPPGLEARMLAAAADSLEVFSLDPRDMLWLGDPVGSDPSRFRNVEVRGSTRVQDAATRQELVREVFHNFHPDKQDLRPYGMGPAYCFEPRHGLRVVDAAGTIDAVICYECGRMIVYSTGEPWEGYILYYGYGREQLQGVLQAAGVPLPPKPDEQPMHRVTRTRIKVPERVPAEWAIDKFFKAAEMRSGLERCFAKEHPVGEAEEYFTVVVAVPRAGKATTELREGLDREEPLGRCVTRHLAKVMRRVPRAAVDASATVEVAITR